MAAASGGVQRTAVVESGAMQLHGVSSSKLQLGSGLASP